MSAPRNRFNVQVVFPEVTFGIVDRKDVDLTPDQVADELEAFCRRIRNGGKVPPEDARMTEIPDAGVSELEGRGVTRRVNGSSSS